MTTTVLECRGLAKRFGDLHAVRDVGFEIAEGETFGLLGPNGAGKTTTISMVCGLLEPDAGEVIVDGRPLRTTTVDVKRAIGYVPQDLAIYPDLSARENLTFFGRLYGMRGDELAGRTDEVLGTVGLRDRADDRTGTYSGGMKRRLNIAIGLLHEPRLLVLDEPTVGVDPQSRNAILESVEALSDAGIAILYTTHYMEEADRLCDRVAIIDEGAIQAEGDRASLVGLVEEHDRVRLTADGDLVRAAGALTDVAGVASASASDVGVELLVDGARGLLPALLQAAQDAGAVVTGVEVEEPDLESVFLHLTGKALRD